jgi:hypothetical protein
MVPADLAALNRLGNTANLEMRRERDGSHQLSITRSIYAPSSKEKALEEA